MKKPVGFDEWCRIRSGLSNKTIAEAISTGGVNYSEATVKKWRGGARIPEPMVTLLPLQLALKEPWPPATAEVIWRELLQVIEDAANQPDVHVPDEPAATEKVAPVVRSSEPAASKLDPALEAIKQELDRSVDSLMPTVAAADQTSLSWFARTAEKWKKYAPKRDAAHRQAFLSHCRIRAEGLLEKARARRTELLAGLEQLGSAIDQFEAMKKECSEKLGRKIDANIVMWREFQAAGPVIARAQQVHDKAAAKSLVSLEEAIKRADTMLADWNKRYADAGQQPAISLSWVTRQSALGERLDHRWQQNRVQDADGQWSWPAGLDPFEGQCVCKDKLADSYKVGEQFTQKNPVDIELACEIDLTVAGLEQRQRLARELCQT